MQGRLPGSREALSFGWKAFRQHAWVLIGVLIIDVAVTFAAGRNEIAKYLFSIFISAPLAGGVITVAVKAGRDQHPSVLDLLAGFRSYLRWQGVYWLFVATYLLAEIPTAIGAMIVSGVSGLKYFHGIPPSFDFAAFAKSAEANPATMPIMNAAGPLFSIIFICLLLRYGFAYYEAAHGTGIVESFKKSAELTKGIRLRLLGIDLVLGLFAVAGILACGVGIIVTALVSWLALVYVYTQLRGEEL